MLALPASTDPAPPPRLTGEQVLSEYSSELTSALYEKGFALLDARAVDGTEYSEALVIFSAPLPETWALLVRGERQTEYRAELERIIPISSFPHGNVMEHRLKILFIGIRYRLRTVFRPDRNHISWQLQPDFDNQLEVASGYWWFHELQDERTLARFGSAIRVGGGLAGLAAGWHDPPQDRGDPEGLSEVAGLQRCLAPMSRGRAPWPALRNECSARRSWTPMPTRRSKPTPRPAPRPSPSSSFPLSPPGSARSRTAG